MDALGVVYPQYLLKVTCKETFLAHMDVLKGFYYQLMNLDQPTLKSQ
jgi:hypothetical protein